MVRVPPDLVAVGRVIDAWGIRGAIKVMPYAHDGLALLEVDQWWLVREGQWDNLKVLGAKVHGDALTATLMGCTTRSVAEGLKGCEVSIARSRFPPLKDDEFYWVDLIGLRVVNLEGVPLGRVESMMETGAHAILSVRDELGEGQGEGVLPEAAKGARKAKVKATLIPFVERYVKSVELDRSRVVVDWGPEYEG